tara:strand:+ start:289 stop:786 length:498 start_codon:yes stop_codon:yes gene_type:complete
MIITCNNCHKKFQIDENLIPDEGRLLQCNNCNNKWFFKKEIKSETYASVDKIDNSNNVIKPDKSSENLELLDKNISEINKIEKDLVNKKESKDNNINLKIEKNTNKRKFNILGLIVVIIISFIALVITFDTFQKPISKFIPNIEFFLYSLYETINDISLFLKDLI